MSEPVTSINRLNIGEIGLVQKIQKNSYKDEYLEKSHTFTRMITIYPQGCLGVSVENNFAAYIFFHPYHENEVKPLNFTLVLSEKEDCMYLHDLAVHRDYRGMGLTGILMERFDKETLLEGFHVQCLVAVQNSQEFWRKYGFKTEFIIENYGDTQAYYMKKYL
jgi:ribosomal protein S18 acetylase RimI-like enzyme